MCNHVAERRQLWPPAGYHADMHAMLPGLVIATVLAAQLAPAQQVTTQPATQRSLLTPGRTLSGHSRLVRCLAFSPRGMLASGGQDRLIRLWSPNGDHVQRIDLRPGGG